MPTTSRLITRLMTSVSALTLMMAMITLPAGSAVAASEPVPGNIAGGGYIISDTEFFASGSMTAAAVQRFLVSKMGTCKAKSGQPRCLRDFTADVPARSADAYCAALSKRTRARAADIIVDVARACGINPKVILTMLQKEQGLVTATAPSAWSYRAAMGQACPDFAPCSAAAAGFVNQVYLGARQMQIYSKNPTSFTYRAGRANTIPWHPDATCGTSTVFIQNQATANLYNYTPYRANISALAAGYGSGDPCSAYGNRNFYNYYVDWFAKGSKTTTGAPSTVAACTKPPAADVVRRADLVRIPANATTVRTAPSTSCTTGKLSVKKGTTYILTGEYAGWLRLRSSAGKTLWTFATNATVIRLTPPPIPGRGTPAPPAR